MLLTQAALVQLAKLAGVSEAGLDHFYKVLRVTAQWELIDETPEGKQFSPNASTRELVRGKEASLGHFVDHQVCSSCSKCLSLNSLYQDCRGVSRPGICKCVGTGTAWLRLC